MTSQALIAWNHERAERLDNLIAAHHAVSGNGAGRRWLTEEVNHALISRLAAEFQGYFRDLHDESTVSFIQTSIPNSVAIRTTVQAVFETGRKLDSGNANWANIVSDFSRFGVSLKDELQARQPARYKDRILRLTHLNETRNALAHNDSTKIAMCEAREKYGLTLATFKGWRSTLNALAGGVDGIMGAYLKDLTGSRPW